MENQDRSLAYLPCVIPTLGSAVGVSKNATRNQIFCSQTKPLSRLAQDTIRKKKVNGPTFQRQYGFLRAIDADAKQPTLDSSNEIAQQES